MLQAEEHLVTYAVETAALVPLGTDLLLKSGDTKGLHVVEAGRGKAGCYCCCCAERMCGIYRASGQIHMTAKPAAVARSISHATFKLLESSVMHLA